jgi:pyruvate dehydrogenase E1 component alpha subunit
MHDALPAGIADARALLEHMMRARVISSRMMRLKRAGRIGSHHASIGHEAFVVGAVLGLRGPDWVFPGPSEWYAALCRGSSLEAYVHHAFGSAADPTQGHACPDHAPSRAVRVVPPSGLPGAHLPQAVGAAWAAKIQRDDVAALALFGAEAVDSGDFHNALNFAGVFRAPVVFVGLARRGDSIASRAVAYGLASATVDGSDALAVAGVVREATRRTTEGKGATLIEVVQPELEDAALTRDDTLAPSTLFELGPHDPIARLRRALERDARLAADLPESVTRDVRDVTERLDRAIALAEAAGAPEASTLFDGVFAEVPPHLAAQRRMLSGG